MKYQLFYNRCIDTDEYRFGIYSFGHCASCRRFKVFVISAEFSFDVRCRTTSKHSVFAYVLLLLRSGHLYKDIYVVYTAI